MTSPSTHSSLHLPTDKTMLDAVMFISTLVSKPNEIDVQLDRVRTITAQRSAKQLTKEDDRALNEVYGYLEDYLVEKEPLRSFTRESIRTKVQDYLQGKRTTSLVGPLSTIWGIAIAVALVSMIIPESIMSNTVKIPLAMTSFLAVLHLGAVWMFWTGLRNFKDKIRQAYLPICIGIAIVGTTLLEVPVAVGLGIDNSVWFRYTGSSITIPIAELLFYIGMRRFALIGGVDSKLLSSKLILALCLGSVLIVNLSPRLSDLPNWILLISLSILTLGAVLSGVAAIVTAKVRQALSSTYKPPMTWFMITLLVSTFSCTQYAILQMLATQAHPYEPAGIAIISLFVSAFVILQAGVSFRKIDIPS